MSWFDSIINAGVGLLNKKSSNKASDRNQASIDANQQMSAQAQRFLQIALDPSRPEFQKFRDQLSSNYQRDSMQNLNRFRSGQRRDTNRGMPVSDRRDQNYNYAASRGAQDASHRANQDTVNAFMQAAGKQGTLSNQQQGLTNINIGQNNRGSANQQALYGTFAKLAQQGAQNKELQGWLEGLFGAEGQGDTSMDPSGSPGQGWYE